MRDRLRNLLWRVTSIPLPSDEESEDEFLASVQRQRLGMFSGLAATILLIASPVVVITYDFPDRMLLAGIQVVVAAALFAVPLTAKMLSRRRYGSQIAALLFSVLLLSAAGSGTALNPEFDHGKGLLIATVAGTVYYLSGTWFWAHYALYLTAVATSWHFGEIAFRPIDGIFSFIVLPILCSLMCLTFESNLRTSYRQNRETLEHQRELKQTLERLVLETTRRHESKRKRRASEEAIEEQQEQLLHVSRLSAMGELAAGIAHEVHQPMHAMSMYCGAIEALVDEDEPDIERVRETVGLVSELLQKCATIIRRLRRFTRKGEREFHRLELHPVIVDAVELTHSCTKKYKVTVQTDLLADTSEVVIDPVQIQQVLVNLIRNACEAMSEEALDQRVIQISTQCGNETLTIRVKDAGAGFDGDAARLFETFYTTKTDGMGMGLAISRTIIGKHQGQIEVTENTDQGVTFTITLPLADFFAEQDAA